MDDARAGGAAIVRLQAAVVGALVILASIGLTLVTLAPNANADAVCKKRDSNGDCIFTDGGDRRGGGGRHGPSAPREGATYTEEDLRSVCGGSAPPGTPDPGYDCMAAHSCLDRTMYRFRVWHRIHTYRAGRWVPAPNWSDEGTECRSFDDPNAVTQADVIREVESFGLRPASAQINPVNGRTLINLETIFYTTAGRYQFRLPNLGPGVDIIATPARFTWHFGDGHSKVTGKPGRPYPHFDVTHVYDGAATVHVNVDVDYRVQWNDGGGWQTIPQTIPGQPGPSTPLTVLENDPVLSHG